MDRPKRIFIESVALTLLTRIWEVAAFVWVLLVYEIIRDTGKRGLSRYYWLLPLLLGSIGGFLYWWIVRKAEKGQQKPLEAQQPAPGYAENK